MPLDVIVGTGLDVQPISRVARFLRDHEDALSRVFTAGERAHCEAWMRGRHARYAAAFAAKEAVMKAIGSGWTAEIEWSDIDTAASTDDGTVVLRGGAARAAARARVSRVFVSTAQTGTVALASAVAVKGPDA